MNGIDREPGSVPQRHSTFKTARLAVGLAMGLSFPGLVVPPTIEAADNTPTATPTRTVTPSATPNREQTLVTQEFQLGATATTLAVQIEDERRLQAIRKTVQEAQDELNALRGTPTKTLSPTLSSTVTQTSTKTSTSTPTPNAEGTRVQGKIDDEVAKRSADDKATATAKIPVTATSSPTSAAPRSGGDGTPGGVEIPGIVWPGLPIIGGGLVGIAVIGGYGGRRLWKLFHPDPATPAVPAAAPPAPPVTPPAPAAGPGPGPI